MIRFGFGAAIGLAVWMMMGCEQGQPLKVETQPSGAKIFLNDRFVGRSPVVCHIRDARPADLWEHHIIEARLENAPSVCRHLRYRSGAPWFPETLVLRFPPGTTRQAETPRMWVPGSANAEPTTAWAIASSRPKAQRHPAEHAAPNPAATEFLASMVETHVASLHKAPPAAVEAPAPQPSPKAPSARDSEFHSPASRPCEPIPMAPEQGPVQLADPPHEDHPVTCELRIARVRDGRVLAQASGMARYGRLSDLAKRLVEQLDASCPSAATVACVDLCDRRDTPGNRRVAEDFTTHVANAIRSRQGMTFVRHVALRDHLQEEHMVECSSAVTAKEMQSHFDGAEYVILGGVALKIRTVDLMRAKEASR